MSLQPLHDRLEAIAREGRTRKLCARKVEGVHVVEADGRRLMNFGGNDYLGVVADETRGCDLQSPHETHGATASALICGWTPRHEALARCIAELEMAEAAVVFPSGYAACSGAIATLAGEGDLILSDELNHASLIDGCRLSKAERVIYPHRDLDFVEHVLTDRAGKAGLTWIVTDGVFSMDGDIAPLPQLADLAERFGAHLMVDEAHGTGVLGRRGGGLCDAMGVSDRVTVRIGTLSKAVGHQGGFVAGPQVVIDTLVNACRSLIYSTSLAPIVAEGAHRVIQRLSLWQDRRDRLAHLSRLFRRRMNLEAGGIEAGIPIIPLVIGEEAETVRASQAMRENGFFVPAIRPPTVAPGQSRLRVSITSAHRDHDIELLADILHRVCPHLGSAEMASATQ
ncbi:MAG TPA: 8-amino-7-oxononanoate synthase [Rhodopirellula baltica]|uniref:8-amino-7-oxononanoate synthase n=1 Tax=Rhodopirellula baltica (strain DSM 10527 / NCIMB 13988 / SH1) TaxID=243090 RepID=Q7UUN9_RHOBA|nr:8-amino-7-oxononanoate synthase [Rhodopirellula baltica]CAD73040.1 8-amino-7-oxononanoate synthase [Rhodopirellula baltica SH 1]HBE61712.1 8-amino-7-oxononanoate synthase [Rhodopirellula baltica]